MFTLPQLIEGELKWIGNSSKTHSLGIVYRGDWTSKKMCVCVCVCVWGGGGRGGFLGVNKKGQFKSGLGLPWKISEIILYLRKTKHSLVLGQKNSGLVSCYLNTDMILSFIFPHLCLFDL